MDLHFIDPSGNHFVVPDAPDGYKRNDATAVDAPPSPEHRWVAGEWKIVPPPQPTKAERKEALKARIRSHGLALRRAGYEANFGTTEAQRMEVLQLRDPTPDNDDEKNWMASLSSYTAAVVRGDGDANEAKFRPESNDTIVVSYSRGVEILTGLFDWVASLMQAVWEKCDAVDRAATHAELDTLEAAVEQGWP